MVSGISKLQRNILKMAYRGLGRSGVTNSDVLIQVYGFHAHAPAAGASGSPKIFNRREIGIRRYKSASVSVSKSFNRLIFRGLVERTSCRQIVLTAAGEREVKKWEHQARRS